MKQFYIYLFASAIGIGSFVSASADDQLVVGTTNATTKYKLTDMQKITFRGDSIVVATAAGTAMHHMGDVTKMHFDVETGVADNLKADLDNVSITVAGGVLTVNAANGVMVNVTVFSMAGRNMASMQGIASASVDFNGYAPGVYVVKANGKTITFVR